MLTTLFAIRIMKRFFGSASTTQATRPTARRFERIRVLAILSVLVTSIAFILSFLCVYAGHTPGMMENYAVFTLNTSQIGQNVLQELDAKISSVKLRRDVPIILPTITAAPTTLITMAPRDIASDFSALTSKAASDVSSVKSAAGSKASSVESAVASKVTSAVGSAETDIIDAVNKAYDGVITDLKLKDFYSVHILTTCSGDYVFANGTNVTVGASGMPANNTHKHVDSCSKHSAVDPVVLIAILYYIGIVFTGVALALSVAGVFITGRKIAVMNVLGSMVAFCFLGLASAVTHGLSLGAAKLINFVGDDIGIAGYQGGKFLHLTWATTCLLLLNIALWSLMCFFGGRRDDRPSESGVRHGLQSGVRSLRRPQRPDRTSSIAMEHLGTPEQAHNGDRNRSEWI